MILLLITLALIGLADSSYILYTKTKGKKLVCLIGKDCDKVVKSKYSHIFKVPNEVLGILFYLSVFGFILLTFLNIGSFLGLSILSLFQAIVFLALLSSAFLTGIQIFKLKELCEYCLATAAINLFIAAIVFLL
ncbi:MAG: vitamin K epoxide reductase family protein [bacterium]|nr:vitamin K epoxide reductase family protein [bacterium]